MRKESNALLQKMHPEDFKATPIYRGLKEDKELAKQICAFLSVTGVDDPEFVVNPDSGQYTSYDQEDFEEVFGYINYCGTHAANAIRYSGYHFVLFESGVGRFIACYKDQLVVGILS